jgi:hypothetical protein
MCSEVELIWRFSDWGRHHRIPENDVYEALESIPGYDSTPRLLAHKTGGRFAEKQYRNTIVCRGGRTCLPPQWGNRRPESPTVHMVGVGGLEPPAPASQTRCAANCATPRGQESIMRTNTNRQYTI